MARPFNSFNLAELAADRFRAKVFQDLLPAGYPLAKFALRFALSNAAVNSVLVGVSEASQLRQAVEAADAGPLTDDQLAAISERYLQLYA